MSRHNLQAKSLSLFNQNSMTYEEVLDFLYTQLPMYQKVGKIAFNKDLGKTIDLLHAIGDPHNLFKSIHVAGTNGKGSTSHLLASVLQEEGLKVGLYTSPHLKSFTERIKINGKEVTKDFVTEFVESSKSLIKEIEPSFFEITVAMSFAYFAKEKVDVAVIETGLGGRLDSTNVITPIMSVITSIGLDHTDILGNSIQSVAYEKAGIIKENIPVVIGHLPKEGREEVTKWAMKRNSQLYDSTTKYRVTERDDDTYDVQSNESTVKEIKSELKGDALALNLSTVFAAREVLRGLGLKLSNKSMLDGIGAVCTNTGLKGRWQILRKEPLVVCDIGHNEQAVSQLVSWMKKECNGQLHIVWGMSSDKSVEPILRVLPKYAKYYFCAADIPRSLEANELSKKAKEEGLQGERYDKVEEAINTALKHAAKSDLIFIGGSTFVVAEIEGI